MPSVPVVNADVASIFEEIADLLEVQGANAFRVRAYRNAARSIAAHRREMRAMVAAGADLEAIPGVGEDLAAKITEIVKTGHSALLDTLHHEVPPGVRALLGVPGLVPARVSRVHRLLGVTSLAELRLAAEQGRLRDVPGIGPSLEARILEGVHAHLATTPRMPHSVAAPIAAALRAELAAVPGVERVEAAGSVRRGCDMVGDLDLVAAAHDGTAAMQRFTHGDQVKRVISSGPTRASIELRDGPQVDLRVVAPESFGAAWLYFTGAKAHGIALRRVARERGLKLNEYALLSGNEHIAGATEEGVYAALGLGWIPPELREDRGEIEASRAGTLPTLLAREDLRGDLHAHTLVSDGHDRLEDLAAHARARGLQYLAITDHSRHLAVAHGLDAGALARQIDRIDALNARGDGLVLLKGVEVDILEDGRLDLPDEVLRRLDLVVGAVHHGFKLSRAKQTARLLRAMAQPCFTILAHPASRLLGDRPPLRVDMDAVIAMARERGCFLELNSRPQRLDLDDIGCRRARDAGVLVSVASDAHRGAELDQLRFGVQQARRGWLGPADVLNTRSLEALRPLLDRTMDRAARPDASFEGMTHDHRNHLPA
jgi:DNA polymerase (family 10)